MRNVFVVTIALFTAAVAGAQYKPQPPAAKSPVVITGGRTANATSFPRISQTEALNLYRQGRAVFIDVRSNTQFSYGHVKGAMSIPGSQIVSRFHEVPVRKTVITYCACSAEQSAGRAAAELVNHGVKNVFALKGGWTEWKSNGYPFAAGPK
jgi:rhodanese-related sulfurtransferase